MVFKLGKRPERSGAERSGSIRNRADLLHRLCRRDSCNSYLEIGCNRNKLFKTIPVEDKVGVDPKRGGTHRMTSD